MNKSKFKAAAAALDALETNSIRPEAARDLEAAAIPPIKWVVKDFLAPGVLLLAARPKARKSYFCLQLCIAVATGSDFLNHKTEQGKALYIDLESNRRRPRARMLQILEGEPAPEDLYIMTSEDYLAPIGPELIEQLTDYIERTENLKIIIIDPLTRLKAAEEERDAYKAAVNMLAPLNKLAVKHNIVIGAVFHTRKEDRRGRKVSPFDDILGSTGLRGTADTNIILEVKRRAENAGSGTIEGKLYAEGRDIQEKEWYMEWSEFNYKWTSRGDAEAWERKQLAEDPLIKGIVALARKHHPEPWTGSGADLKAALHEIDPDNSPAAGMSLKQLGLALKSKEDLIEERGAYITRKHGRRCQVYEIVLSEWRLNNKISTLFTPSQTDPKNGLDKEREECEECE